MKSVAEHLDDCLEVATPLPSFLADLRDAVGCVLLKDVLAAVDLPQADRALCDGYALRHADVTELPCTLPVLDVALAREGNVPRLIQGAAVRVSSGATLPDGADTVVPSHLTDFGDAHVEIRALPAHPGIQRKGSDRPLGEVIIEAGTRLTPRHTALLAAAGHDRALVRPAPRVVVMSVGDELVNPGAPLPQGATYDATSTALAASIEKMGAFVSRVACVSDERTTLRSMIQDQLVRADVLIITGGLSLAPDNTVRDVLAPLGAMRFDNVAMEPGGMMGVGTITDGEDTTKVFCLPGNPVACLVAYEVFVRPCLRAITGHTKLQPRVVAARAREDFTVTPGVVNFPRVNVTPDASAYAFTLTGPCNKLSLYDYAHANALALIPAEKAQVAAGEEFECLVFA